MADFLERELGSGGDLLTSATARAAALARAGAACRSVSVPVRVRRRPDGVVAFDVPVAPGASLAEVRAGRALSVGECVTVGVAVAEALAALHAERVAHGDVSPANVVVSGKRVALVDTMGALSGERGTPGFAEPEREDGVTPAGDIYALGALLRSLADGAATPAIEAWTAPLLANDPSLRPTAAHAARALARCAAPEAIVVPAAGVAAAMRSGALPRTAKRPQDRWWRAERTAIRLAPLAALGVVAVATGWSLMPAVAANDVPRTGRAAGEVRVDAPVTIPLSAAALIGPVDAAVAITVLRVATLAEGDAVGLRALSLEGAPAARDDAETAAGLASGELSFEGLEVRRVDAELAEMTLGGAIVKVTTELSGYSVGHSNTDQHTVPSGTATALVELRLTQRGWLVERILPPP